MCCLLHYTIVSRACLLKYYHGWYQCTEIPWLIAIPHPKSIAKLKMLSCSKTVNISRDHSNNSTQIQNHARSPIPKEKPSLYPHHHAPSHIHLSPPNSTPHIPKPRNDTSKFLLEHARVTFVVVAGIACSCHASRNDGDGFALAAAHLHLFDFVGGDWEWSCSVKCFNSCI